jgi:hypothetical protein
MKKLLAVLLFVFVAAGTYAQTPDELFKGEPPLNQQDLDIFLGSTQVFVEAGKQSTSVEVEKILTAAGLNAKRSLYVYAKVVANFRLYYGNELLGQNYTKEQIRAAEEALAAPLKMNTLERSLMDKNKTAIKAAHDVLFAGL